jgi:hypothetical protein
MSRPLVVALAALWLSGCLTLSKSNPRFREGGAWKLDAPYALTPMVVCAYAAQGNDQVIEAIQDDVAPALWHALGQPSEQAKVLVRDGQGGWCEGLPEVPKADWEVPRKLRKQLVEYVQQSGAKGVIIPVGWLYSSQNQNELVSSDGQVLATSNAPGRRAMGTGHFYLFYVTDQGDVAYSGHVREDDYADYTLNGAVRAMRHRAGEVAAELVKDAPAVALR